MSTKRMELTGRATITNGLGAPQLIPRVEPMNIEVSLANLRAGIRVFKVRKWPADFHAGLYARQAKQRAGGLTEHWWSETVDDLGLWLATRPLSKADVRERGLMALSRLNSAYDQLPRVGTEFGEIGWSSLSRLFDVACSIKPTLRPSPVFPSKLCHFLRPDLYVVVDRAVVGLLGPYPDVWAACSKAWRHARPIHDELRHLLAQSATESLPSTYPFGTKITELCVIGTKARARKTP
jgi:hypothetical protein